MRGGYERESQNKELIRANRSAKNGIQHFGFLDSKSYI